MKVDRNPTKPNALGKSNMQKTSSTYLNSRFSETRITPRKFVLILRRLISLGAKNESGS